MPRWSTSPSAGSARRAGFVLAALTGHAALAVLLLGQSPRALPEAASPPALRLELAAPADPPAEPQALLVATDLPEPPPPTPVTWPAPPIAPIAALAPRPAPPVARPPAPARGTAPAVPSAPAAPTASAIATWHAALLAWIEQHRRYPPAARIRQEEGVVQLRFTLDPEGGVLHAEILAESGSPALDAAALALLRGARLPAPPPGTAAADRTVTAPIRYRLQ